MIFKQIQTSIIFLNRVSSILLHLQAKEMSAFETLSTKFVKINLPNARAK